MRGWILYKRSDEELSEQDHGVNRLIKEAAEFNISLKVYKPTQLTINNISGDIFLMGKRTQLPDFIIPRLGAETSYYALIILRHLELSGVYSFNNVDAIELVKDKMRVSQVLFSHQLPTPKTMLVSYPVSLPLIEAEIGFPLLVKTISGARGLGIFLCHSPDVFIDLMSFFPEPEKPLFIVQQFIKNSFGRDIRVFLVGDKILGCMQRRATTGFKANYSLGGTVSQFKLTQEIADLALRCSQVLNLEIAGIDLLFDDHQFTICEANSSPGFKGLELATGENIGKQIMHYIANKLT